MSASYFWPQSRLAEAVHLLADRAGLSPRITEVDAWLPPENTDAVERWLQSAADAMGVEAEPITCRYPELKTALQGVAPGLLKITAEDSVSYLAVLGRRGGKLLLLTTTGDVAGVRLRDVRGWLAEPAEARFSDTIERVMKHVSPRRRQRARQAMCDELLRLHRLPVGWLLRPAPQAGWSEHAGRSGLWFWLTALAGSHFAAVAFWVFSWWLLGWAALRGVPDGGWLWAWGLALATMAPLRILASYATGAASLRIGVILKQRLLSGALRLPTDQARGQGVGAMLGRVLETESLDGMALAGAFMSLTAVVELTVAGAVLACGAAPGGHLFGLAATVAGTAWATWRYARIHPDWTDQRLALTTDLIEKMLGHRTRLAQQDPAVRHAGEDIALENYVRRSADLDRANAWLQVGPSRVWLLVSCAVLCVAMSAPPTALAISLGGVMLAAAAFRELSGGLSRLAAARTIWRRIAELRQAADQAAYAPPPIVSPAMEEDVLIEGRRLGYRYANRPNAVLSEVDLQIRGQDRLLLEGDSGGGKSTLAGLLGGSRQPSSGVLLLGGLDRASLGDDFWRQRIVLAPQFQENHLVMGSLAFNLLLGRRWPPTGEDLQQAEAVCLGLGLGPLLERMPSGIHQIVGETGWRLSHGERSRVFLARACLQDGELLLLDESFAALDPATQIQVFEFVCENAPAMLVIAHP